MARRKHNLFSLKIYDCILWAGHWSYFAILHFSKYPLFHFSSPLSDFLFSLTWQPFFPILLRKQYQRKDTCSHHQIYHLPIYSPQLTIQLLPSTQEHCPAIAHSPLCILNICSLYSIISDNPLTWCNWAHHKKHPWLNPPSRPPTSLPFIIKREIIHEHDQASTSSLPIFSWATSLRFPIQPLHWNCPCQGHQWPPFSISYYLFSILISPYQYYLTFSPYNYSFFL